MIKIEKRVDYICIEKEKENQQRKKKKKKNKKKIKKKWVKLGFLK